jgi:hypothetical protein
MRQKKKTVQAGGSMSTIRNAAALVNTGRVAKRWAIQEKDDIADSETVLTASQSPGELGSQFTAITMTFAGVKLSANLRNWIQSHDAYRVTRLEVYATLTAGISDASQLNNIPVIHYAFVDMDTDPSVVTSWFRTMDRDNLSRTVLRANQPSALIATFCPRPSFRATGTQDPGNLIGSQDSWLDALNLTQIYTGLRCYSYCPAAVAAGQPGYKYKISYNVRYYVEGKAPI